MSRLIGLAAVLALVVGSAATVAADEGGPNFTFGASTSFTYDFQDPDRGDGENNKLYANLESEESFNIDLVQLGVSGTRGPVSYGAKVDFGDLAAYTGDDADADVGLQELFLAIDAGFVTVIAGRVPTPIGYETLEPWANPNISKSRAWTFQPVNHDGLAVSGEVGDFSGMIGVVNGFQVNDPTGNNIDDEYGIIGLLSLAFGDASLRLSGIYSQENDEADFLELNSVLGGNFRNYRYGLEGTFFDKETDDPSVGPSVPNEQVWDVTTYAGGSWSVFSGDLRVSYTHENDTTAANFGGSPNNHFWSFTGTAGYEIVEGVVVRAEYRFDLAQNDVFFQDDDAGVPSQQNIHVVQAQLMWTPAIGD